MISHLKYIKNNACNSYSSDELFLRSRDGYFGVYFPSCEATREINTKITLEWMHKQFVTWVYTLFHFLHDITNLWMAIKTMIFTHQPRVSLVRFTFCWWRHNRLLRTFQLPYNCDAITWIMISNSIVFTAIFMAGHVRNLSYQYENTVGSGPVFYLCLRPVLELS